MKVFEIFLVLFYSLFLATCVAAKQSSKIVILRPDSAQETALVDSYKNDGFDEVSMEDMIDRNGNNLFGYKIKVERPISKVLLIVPKYVYLNGSSKYFEEFKDFRVFCKRRSVVIESREVGFIHVSIVTKVKGRGKRAVASSNMILNAGMTAGCQNVCDPKKKSCSTDPCKHLPPATLECPPNNDCNIISHDASIYNSSSGILVQPVGNAVVVKSCDAFIQAVMNKFNKNGGKVDVYLDAHGNHGLFTIGVFGGNPEIVSKGSTCYSKICMQLRNKIKTLTLFTCSTAGGTSGPGFIQCLANCLGATVKAWKKKVSIQASWNTTTVSSIKWSTPRNYSKPCEATPTPTITPSHSTPTPTPNPTFTSTYSTPTHYTSSTPPHYTSSTSTHYTSSTNIPTPTPPTETPFYDEYDTDKDYNMHFSETVVTSSVYHEDVPFDYND